MLSTRRHRLLRLEENESIACFFDQKGIWHVLGLMSLDGHFINQLIVWWDTIFMLTLLYIKAQKNGWGPILLPWWNYQQSFFIPKVSSMKVWAEVKQLNFVYIAGSQILSDFWELDRKRKACPALGLNPRPLACEASVLTTQPRPLLIQFTKIRV